MSIEGLWTAEFYAPGGTGTGVAVLKDGKILGGDSTYYYEGSYSDLGKLLKGEIAVIHYSGPLNNVFGAVRNIHLSLEGAIGGDLIMAQGRAAGFPGSMSIRLRRVGRF